MERFEIIKNWELFQDKLTKLADVIKPDQLSTEIKEFNQKMLEPGFWDDSTLATQLIAQNSIIKNSYQDFIKLKELVEELSLIISLDDPNYYPEAETVIDQLGSLFDEFETKQLLDGEYDQANAIVELHPGAGGTESQDWALMLYRMFKRFCERHNFSLETLDYQEASEAGVKSVTFLVKAPFAYGNLKSEKGVHRLVRISPFDSNARRHTSFCACNVTPQITPIQENELVINPEELKIDTYRSSGAGGQHVNTTDSAVRITHLPTGTVVCCQNERSQIQNRDKAMSILKSKLYKLAHRDIENKIKSISGELDENGFGSQIRSYVLHPYALVKDHRTNYESTNPNNVLDGALDDFINAYLRYNKADQ